MTPLAVQTSSQLLFLLFVLLVALHVALHVAYQQFLSPMAKIPGPFGASLSRLWMAKHAWQGDM
jgi:hypothetical protein